MSMSPAPALAVRGVTVAYGAVPALDDFSLEVGQGEVVAVVGPSGSGKSALLRAIAGLELVDGGEIEAGGRSLAGVPTHRRDLGLMFQDHALFPHLDVAANVAFGLRMKRWPAQRQRKRVGELLELVGLVGFGGREVHELSGGEAQRVALARALAPEPGLLMLDEPFGSLDRLLREELTMELRRLLVDLGQTALHVTHDQVEAFAVADRVAVLRDGRMQQVGEPIQLWQAPRSAFVAEFLGHPNIWPVMVSEEGAVSVGGHCWAESSDWAPGPAVVVVPIGALRVEAGGPLVVEVQSVVFREGRRRVSGVLDGSGRLPVIFESTGPLSSSGVIRITVDVDVVHRLE